MRIGIVGGGCAGSSLAYFLVRGGFSGEIDIFDRRTNFDAEQRWCSWGPIPEAFAPLVSASWPNWMVADQVNAVVRTSKSRPYVHIYAPDFYRHVFARLATSARVRVHLGVTVSDVEDTARGVRIVTNNGAVLVDHVFDSRPQRPETGPEPETTHRSFRQSFVGHVVRTERPVFDASTVTLMDFRGRFSETDSLPFTYVLPFESTRALVESTAFGARALRPDEHRRRIQAYLVEHGVTNYVVEREEQGNLPMSATHLLLAPSAHHSRIGTGAGALRPSSGYGFVRIQRHAQAVAAALLRDEPLPTSLARPLDDALDAIFLDAMDLSGGGVRDGFMRMFERVPPARLIRFMSDEGTLGDVLALIRALPPRPYIGAALRQLSASTSRLPIYLAARVGA